jgi:hypothetical protein
VNNLTEDIKWTEAAYTNKLFVINPWDVRTLEEPGKDEKIKNTLSFNETGLKN